jgi:GT2 family glycosyltransferase
MDLSIIIINYCTYGFTKQAIESIIRNDYSFCYEIVVVDNASPDGSLKKLQSYFVNETSKGLIKFIRNKKNMGFAHANNIALKTVTSKYVLLLNSDTIIVENCLEKCLKQIEMDSSIGVLGCRVMFPDGHLDKACRRSFPTFSVSFYRMTGLSRIFPKSKRFGQYNLTYLDDAETYEVDCLTGAFMLVRTSAIDEVGLLDETFFMYGEDIDWCYRIKSAGWKVLYYGDAKVVHYKGASSSSGKNKRKTIYEFYRSMHIFYNKHYKNHYPSIVNYITYIGIWGQYRINDLVYRLTFLIKSFTKKKQ